MQFGQTGADTSAASLNKRADGETAKFFPHDWQYAASDDTDFPHAEQKRSIWETSYANTVNGELRSAASTRVPRLAQPPEHARGTSSTTLRRCASAGRTYRRTCSGRRSPRRAPRTAGSARPDNPIRPIKPAERAYPRFMPWDYTGEPKDGKSYGEYRKQRKRRLWLRNLFNLGRNHGVQLRMCSCGDL